MRLTFLSAAVPLTKSIALSPTTGEYTTTSYPMVSKMTSHEEEVQDMMGFARALVRHGRAGHCLLKGELDRPIVDESRAGHAVLHADHSWVCFDFDKVDCPPTFEGAVEAIEKYLPPAAHDVDCVIQLSASCFHPEARMLSAHVFMRLDQAQSTTTLNDWFLSLNFTPETLKELRLSDSQLVLSYPIDRSVASQAKLLYIAPPRTIGFKPNSNEFVQFLPGDRRSLTIPAFKPVSAEDIRRELNRLREAIGLPPKDYQTQVIAGQEFFKDIDEEVTIHDVKVSASGHLRFNINGGDSMAYYIDLKNPHVIGNFKGEPFMHTNIVAKKFYDTLKKAAPAAAKNMARISDGTEVLAFYATNRGSAVYVGTYDRTNDILRVDRSNTEAAHAWLVAHGAPLKATLPHYDLLHDISSDVRYEEGYPVINMYARTEFLKQYGGIARTLALDNIVNTLRQTCPVAYKILLSVCGSDEETLRRYLNWLAYIFQTREKPGSAWLFHGTEGTGKGFMVQHLLTPLFGEDQVVQVLMKDVTGNFNSLLEGKLIVNIDEASLSKTTDPVEVMSRLRNWITETKTVINEKNRVEQVVRSFANWIITSNDNRPIIVPPGDRRWNVAPRQETRINIYPNEYAVLVQGEELPQFAQLLGGLQVDEELTRNPENNQAKKNLFEATHGLPDAVALALRDGNTSFFLAARPSAAQLATGKALLPMNEYDELLRGMLNGDFNVLTQADLYVLFKVAINDDRQFPENVTAQRKLYRRLNLTDFSSRYCKRQCKSVYSMAAPEWQQPDEEFIDTIESLGTSIPTNSNVVPMARRGV